MSAPIDNKPTFHGQETSQVSKQSLTGLCLGAAAVTLDKESFCQAVAVVVAHAAYLPSVDCFALLPVASTMARTGADTGAALDYDIDNACVTLTAQRTIRYHCFRPFDDHCMPVLTTRQPSAKSPTKSPWSCNPLEIALFTPAVHKPTQYMSTTWPKCWRPLHIVSRRPV